MIRVGHGFDVHRFADGRRLVLGGVTIEHPRGLAGHSDADVVLHALCDALLGAAALGDVGRHFPDSDAAFKGADSRELLRRTVEVLAEARWRPEAVDMTIAAEEPRLASHFDAMRQSVAADLSIEVECVSVKATTTEALGFVGRREGIAAWAVCTISPVE